MASYFYRIEFQQRGAPHVHSVLWLKDEENKEAPNFWFDPQTAKENTSDAAENNDMNEPTNQTHINNRKKDIETFGRDIEYPI